MKQIHVFRRLLQYVAKYKSKLVLIAVLGLIGVTFEVAKPLPLKIVIDNVLSNQPLPGFLADIFSVSDHDGKKRLLYACVGIMIVISVFNFVLTVTVFNLTVSMAQRLVFDLMTDFFAKVQKLSLSFY